MLTFYPVPATTGRILESPVWDARESAILWCDIPAGKIFELKLDAGAIGHGARRSWSFDGPVGSFGLADDGRLVVACGRSVFWLDRDTGAISLLAHVEDDGSPTRLNDGKVGPDGAFWIGSMDDTAAKAPVGGLYRVLANGKVERKASGIMTSNGLAWSADAAWMFHADSRGPVIDRWDFDVQTGAIAGRQRIATLDEASGRPDGGATDQGGVYWSAGVSAGRLNLFNFEGALLGIHPFPVPAPTMPCFGGPDLQTLFVTSLRRPVPDEEVRDDPLSGAIFYAHVEVPGVAISRFQSC